MNVLCEQLNLSAGSVGLLMIGLSLPYGAASPIFGVISDKYPVSQHLNNYQHVYCDDWKFLKEKDLFEISNMTFDGLFCYFPLIYVFRIFFFFKLIEV